MAITNIVQGTFKINIIEVVQSETTTTNLYFNLNNLKNSLKKNRIGIS